MKPSVVLGVLVTGSCCVFLAAVAAQSEIVVYGKVGDKVVLKPSSVPGTITSIIWKDGPNIAMEWDGATEVDSFRHFKERGHLNTSTGEMTITGLYINDSGVYKLEINHNEVTPHIRLKVLLPVPVPTVNTICNNDNTSCSLTCDGNTEGAEPVTYTWKSDDKVVTNLSKVHHITKEESSSVYKFSCELKNPFSEESSKPIPNPFRSEISQPEEKQSKAITGVVVFLGLLAPVVLLALVHRLKTGVWFYEKASMPWEADFWTNEKKKTSADANDAAREEPPEAETLMA
ncbi:hypothetical protein Q5P01_005684 [Channa striata]|uniref:Uncharacterized protein n=1 Tax=Channa striata TaxID=64152 RepID=A0AA88ND70_CHASR|nr:hypothetical protein Q5P01_005684 [Channa striata]